MYTNNKFISAVSELTAPLLAWLTYYSVKLEWHLHELTVYVPLAHSTVEMPSSVVTRIKLIQPNVNVPYARKGSYLLSHSFI